MFLSYQDAEILYNFKSLLKFSCFFLHPAACEQSDYTDFFLFIYKHIYNRHIDKIKKTKTKIHKTVIRCKATATPAIKLKEEQLQN